MNSHPTTSTHDPRPLHARRWRTLAIGGVLAGVGFVAAQAGSLDFLQLEVKNLAANAADEKPIVVRASTDGRHRGYSTATGGAQEGGSIGAARGASASGPGAELSFKTSDTRGAGGAMLDGGLFDQLSAAIPMGMAGSQDASWSGGRFHPPTDGFSSGSGRPGYGAGGSQRSQKGLEGCCSETEEQPGDPLLTAPLLDAAISGPVPEGGAWMMMILGFGLSGLVLGGRRRAPA